jgi:predicted outer membrane repeat protein
MTSGENCNDDEGDDSFDEWVTTSITGAVFAYNGAGDQGGAVANENSGFSWLSFDINKSTFWGNLTTDNGMGAALNSDRSDAVVSNSYFAWNESDNQGGAMEFCGADLTLINTDFYENHVWDNNESGGAVRFQDGCGSDATLKIEGSSFDSNGAGRNGGAIARTDDGRSDDFIKNSTFTDNTTGNSGGAVYTEADLVVTGSTFDDNHAQEDYSSNTHGGAIAAWGGNESLTVSGSIFRDNTSGWNGGAIAVRDNSYLTISSSLFDGNISRDEGGAVMGYSDIEGMEILNSTFTNNLAIWDDGGAIFFTGQNGADFTVSNSKFTDNSSGSEGGAIYARLRGNSSTGTSLMAVTKSTFTGNIADADGGAINHDVSGDEDFALLTITDSTFTRNEANSDGGAIDSSGTVIVTGNRFVGNTTYYDNAGALQLNYLGSYAFSVISKNTFENNAAARPFENNLDTIRGDGGAIEFDQRVVITNNSFVRNTAIGKNENSNGGAIEGSGYGTTVMNNSFLNNASSGNGGALSFYNFSYDELRSKITGNTFDSNAAGNGGGAMWIEDNEGTNDFKAQISDNRILRNTAMNGAGLYMAWQSDTPRFVAPTGILRNVFERNIASVNGGGIMIEYYGGAYRDSRAAQQSLIKAVKNNRYVGNKANRDRSTATVGGLNVPVGIFIGSLSVKDVEPVAE